MPWLMPRSFTKYRQEYLDNADMALFRRGMQRRATVMAGRGIHVGALVQQVEHNLDMTMFAGQKEWQAMVRPTYRSALFDRQLDQV